MVDERPVLVVEDEPLIALDVAAALQDQGWRVLGPACTPEDAMRLIAAERPAVALVDVVLGEATAEEIFAQLNVLQVPTILLTGLANPEEVSPRFAGVPKLEKPFAYDSLIAALERIAS